MGESYAPGTPGSELDARNCAPSEYRRAHRDDPCARAVPGVTDEALASASQVIFAIYVTQLRLWLNDEVPRVEEGIARLMVLRRPFSRGPVPSGRLLCF
jgi:hypothetical protein